MEISWHSDIILISSDSPSPFWKTIQDSRSVSRWNLRISSPGRCDIAAQVDTTELGSGFLARCVFSKEISCWESRVSYSTLLMKKIKLEIVKEWLWAKSIVSLSNSLMMVLIFWTIIRNSDPPPERARVFVCGKDERKTRPHQNSISSHRFSSPAILSVFSRRKQQIFFKVWFWTMIYPKRFLRSTWWAFFFW